MTTYTAIPDADVDTDSPLTQTLLTLLRDNPLAIQEGDSSASGQRIKRGAIQNGVGHRWFYDFGDGSDGSATWTTSTKAPGLYQFTTLTLSASNTITLSKPGVIVICATTSITINGTLDVDGMGAQGPGISDTVGRPGMWGGSGGGSRTNGGGSTYLTDGGATATAGAAQSSQTKNLLLATTPVVQIDDDGILSVTRDEVFENYSLGGGSGGGDTSGTAGDGGGVVILCAPVITIGAAGVITADGTNGGTDCGGGGGGAIVIATPSGGYTNNGSVAATFGTGSAVNGANGAAGWVEEITL